MAVHEFQSGDPGAGAVYTIGASGGLFAAGGTIALLAVGTASPLAPIFMAFIIGGAVFMVGAAIYEALSD